MAKAVPESVRAVVLTPEGTVLLMEVQAGDGAGRLWITPGGRRRPGEDTVATLRRELREETGLRDVASDGEVWVRRGAFVRDGRMEQEVERFHLVRHARFEPIATDIGADEAKRFVRFRWWRVEEIDASRARFVPRRLAPLLRALDRDGVPPTPVDVSDDP